MPGFSWGIPAKNCRVGSILAVADKGTVCNKCYARRGFYALPRVKASQERRLQAWREEPQWIELMTLRILLLYPVSKYFRWFDSGDLQSEKMFLDIKEVVQRTAPFIEHWLPSREYTILRNCNALVEVPDNLVVRYSLPMFDSFQRSTAYLTSSVTKEGRTLEHDHLCPSSEQGNKCLACRACWDKRIQHVVYNYH